jgi:hypothetical protein
VVVGENSGFESCRQSSGDNDHFPGVCPTDLAEENTYGYSCSHTGPLFFTATALSMMLAATRRRPRP